MVPDIKKKIKVLHLIYSLEVGGAETVIKNYAMGYDRENFSLVVCAIDRGGRIAKEIEKEGVRVFILNSKVGSLSTIWKLSRLMREEKIDIVHVHNPAPNIVGIPAALLAGRLPVIRTEHNIFYAGRVHKYYPILNLLLGLSNKKIIAVSEAVRDSHLKKDPISKNKYITIYNGIDNRKFDIAIDNDTYLKEFGIPDKSFVIGIVASLTRQKGHEFFFQTAKQVLSKEPDAFFLIVGDGPLRKDLNIFADKLDISSRVVFTGLRKDIPELLNFIDIFVLSSLWEGFPMTILEAMAAGRPVIATDVGGNSEAVVNGVTGFLTKPENIEEQTEAVLHLIRDRDLACRMGREGKMRVKHLFSIQQMVKKTENVYLECL